MSPDTGPLGGPYSVSNAEFPADGGATQARPKPFDINSVGIDNDFFVFDSGAQQITTLDF